MQHVGKILLALMVLGGLIFGAAGLLAQREVPRPREDDQPPREGGRGGFPRPFAGGIGHVVGRYSVAWVDQSAPGGPRIILLDSVTGQLYSASAREDTRPIQEIGRPMFPMEPRGPFGPGGGGPPSDRVPPRLEKRKSSDDGERPGRPDSPRKKDSSGESKEEPRRRPSPPPEIEEKPEPSSID